MMGFSYYLSLLYTSLNSASEPLHHEPTAGLKNHCGLKIHKKCAAYSAMLHSKSLRP